MDINDNLQGFRMMLEGKAVKLAARVRSDESIFLMENANMNMKEAIR